MSKFFIPEPIIDAREKDLIQKLTKDYEKFVKPGIIGKSALKVQNGLSRVLPEKLKTKAKEAAETAREIETIKKALEVAGKGFISANRHLARYTLSHDKALEVLCNSGCIIDQYVQICSLRSYQIEHVVSNDYKQRVLAFMEGAITSAPGIYGLPFNLALSFLLYFRAAQSIALHYGYDVIHDPRELQIASEVTIKCLSPNMDEAAETVSGVLGKMMVSANVTALRESLKKRTYQDMAKRGGAELLYVQIRALANKAAKKALDKAGKEGLENSIFRKALEALGKKMPAEAGKKAVPVIGALIGGFSDTYYMGRVLYGSNLIYHKRFLFEKDQRVSILRGNDSSSLFEISD